MRRYARKTLRKMPPEAREIAKLTNELASVQTRLSNRIGQVASMEMMAKTPRGAFCNDHGHRELVGAVLRFLEIWDSPTEGDKVHEAMAELAELRTAAAPFWSPFEDGEEA